MLFESPFYDKPQEPFEDTGNIFKIWISFRLAFDENDLPWRITEKSRKDLMALPLEIPFDIRQNHHVFSINSSHRSFNIK
jgi:hypothetical protein